MFVRSFILVVLPLVVPLMSSAAGSAPGSQSLSSSSSSSHSSHTDNQLNHPAGASSSSSMVGASPPQSLSLARSGAPSVDISVARLLHWQELYRAGGMSEERRLRAVSDLLDLSDDILEVDGNLVRDVLSVVRLPRMAVGNRSKIITTLAGLKDQLRSKLAVTEKGQTEDAQTDTEAVTVSEDEEAEEGNLPVATSASASASSSSPHPSRSSPRRTASVPDYRSSSSQQQAGLSDMEVALVESLLPKRDRAKESTLTPAGKRLLKQMREQQHLQSQEADADSGAAAPLSPASPAYPPPVRPSVNPLSSESRRAMQTIPSLNFALPSATAQSSVKHSKPLRRAAPVSSCDSEDEGSSYVPIARSSRRNDGDFDDDDVVDEDADLLPRRLQNILARWGVPDGVCGDNLYVQANRMVYPTSFHSFWSSKRAMLTGANSSLYYEGLVLSVLLDYSEDPEVWKELAARRWIGLWAVANGTPWKAAEAFLPLTVTQGLTARQFGIMNKFSAFQSQSRSSASTTSSSSSSSPSRGNRKGRQKSNDSSNNSTVTTATTTADHPRRKVVVSLCPRRREVLVQPLTINSRLHPVPRINGSIGEQGIQIFCVSAPVCGFSPS